jgi:hypothetical protein
MKKEALGFLAVTEQREKSIYEKDAWNLSLKVDVMQILPHDEPSVLHCRVMSNSSG